MAEQRPLGNFEGGIALREKVTDSGQSLGVERETPRPPALVEPRTVIDSLEGFLDLGVIV